MHLLKMEYIQQFCCSFYLQGKQYVALSAHIYSQMQCVYILQTLNYLSKLLFASVSNANAEMKENNKTIH